MESMGDRIKRLRIENNLTQEELGEKLGLKKAAINKYEAGSVENIKRSVVGKMSKIFNVNPSYLMAFDDLIEDLNLNISKTVDLNFYGSVSAGGFEESYANEQMLSVPKNIIKHSPSDYFLLKVNGDSMNKVIANDHYVVVLNYTKNMSATFKTNDIIIARNGSEFTMKRIRKTDTKIHLEPDSYSNEFEVQSFDIDEFNELQIIGKVVYSFKNFI